MNCAVVFECVVVFVVRSLVCRLGDGECFCDVVVACVVDGPFEDLWVEEGDVVCRCCVVSVFGEEDVVDLLSEFWVVV